MMISGEPSATKLNQVRKGRGKPLLLVHGLGGSWRSWTPILEPLASAREVIAIDLPGHGETPVMPGADTIKGLTDAVDAFVAANDLRGVDLVGSSMGARLVVELARRGNVGATVALDPGGFWQGWERTFFATTIGASIRLVRALQPAMPFLTRHAAGRTTLLAQLSAYPWRLSPDIVLTEMRSFAATPTFDALCAIWHMATSRRAPHRLRVR